MSNYPPGVTGFEPQIAGPRWEGELERTCNAENVTIKIVRADDGREFELPLDVCPWIDGEVDAQESRSEIHWTCPACGTEHVEEPPEPDPDAAWDSRFDSL